MKKLLTIVMLSCIFIAAKSQVYVQGGVNLANITANEIAGKRRIIICLQHLMQVF